MLLQSVQKEIRVKVGLVRDYRSNPLNYSIALSVNRFLNVQISSTNFDAPNTM